MDDLDVAVTHQKKLLACYGSLCSMGHFLYDSERRLVMGRSGRSWAQIGACYLLFYSSLGALFVGLFALFGATLDATVPTYYSATSVMDTKTGINPGLGFRPQLDPEDLLIAYSAATAATTASSNASAAAASHTGGRLATLATLTTSLRQFLDANYAIKRRSSKKKDSDEKNKKKKNANEQEKGDDDDVSAEDEEEEEEEEEDEEDEDELTNCAQMSLEDVRARFYAQRRAYCAYDYERVLAATSCAPAADFGYRSGPCVLVKLNKIYSWLPDAYKREYLLDSTAGSTSSDNQVNALFVKLNLTRSAQNVRLLSEHVLVKCEGEYAADVDALSRAHVRYYSAVSGNGTTKVGLLPIYYYPYLHQPGYKAPLVFVHFERLPTCTLINVVCRAYAANVDNADKLNLRGMTRFQLYFEK